MTITVVFDPPLPSDSPSTFNTKAFALLGDLNTWSAEANAMPAALSADLSALLAAGTQTASLVSVSVSGGAFAQGKMYATAAGGTVITGKTGSSNDMMLLNPAGSTIAYVPTGTSNLTFLGAITVSGAMAQGAITSQAGTSYSISATDRNVVFTAASTVTVTLPAASALAGRTINIKNQSAAAVISASSNVIPLGSGTAGTAILAATAGKWATLVSDGTNWQIMSGN